MSTALRVALLGGAGFVFLTSNAQAQTVAAPAAPPEQAQSTAPDTSPNNGGDIIVTAQKRSERLQDVPIAITAVTGENLATRGVTDTQNLARVSPSLTYTQGANPSNSTFRIRGIGTQLFGQGGESSVSAVVDGVVLARQAQGFTDLADIERVEVLRGPQGTVFGKNATGGVINIITADPSRQFTGRVDASVAEMGEYHVKGSMSGPLGDALSYRVSGFYNKDDGYIYNAALREKTNGYESWGIRGKLMLDLGRLNLLASGDYNRNNATCCQPVAIRTDNATLAQLQGPIVAGSDNTQVVSNLEWFSRTRSQIYSLRAKYDMDSVEVTSITAYQKYYFNNNNDVDALNTPQPIYAGGNGNPPYYAQFEVNGGPIDLHQFSEEFRVGSTGTNRLNYVVGGYYEDLHLDRGFQRRIVTCPTTVAANQGLAVGAVCPAPVGTSGSSVAVLDSRQYAGFANLDFLLVGGLKLLGGLRVQHQDLTVTGRQNAAAPFAGDNPAFTGAAVTSGTAKAKDTVVTYKVGAQYEFSRNAQVYATYGTGYKGQSLGTEYNQTFNNNPVVAPETVKAYEVGFKGSTADRLVTIAADLFLADYRNLQVQANRSDQATGNLLFVTTNAGKARTKGFEIETTLRPDQHYSVAIGVAYAKARFDADGIGCPLQNQAAFVTVPNGGAQPANTCFRQVTPTGTVSGSVQNVRNGVLPNSPLWRINLNPHYERPVGKYIGYIDASGNFQSGVTFALEQDPLLIQRAYVTVDLTVGIRPRGRGLSASVFVRNLGNTRYYTSVSHNTELTSPTLTPNNLTGFLPKAAFRYIGGTVGYSF